MNTFIKKMGIDLLIGVDLFYEMLLSDISTGPDNWAILRETVLGCKVSGGTPATSSQHDPLRTFLHPEKNSLVHNLNHFWEVEPF